MSYDYVYAGDLVAYTPEMAPFFSEGRRVFLRSGRPHPLIVHGGELALVAEAERGRAVLLHLPDGQTSEWGNPPHVWKVVRRAKNV